MMFEHRRLPLESQLPGFDIGGTPGQQQRLLALGQFDLQCRHGFLGNLVLQLEQLAVRSFIALGPDVMPALRFDEVHRNT